MNERKRAKKPPEYLNDAVIYQIFLRAFTPAGTLKSAEKMLPHIKSIGADIVYLLSHIRDTHVFCLARLDVCAGRVECRVLGVFEKGVVVVHVQLVGKRVITELDTYHISRS